MIVSRGAGDSERNFDNGVEAAGVLPGNVEDDAVDSRVRISRRPAAVVVCEALCDQAMFSKQSYRHTSGRLAHGSIEHVRRKAAHSSSNFSNRSWVIFDCSRAAIESSVAESLRIRDWMDASISLALLPFAQIIKIQPNLRS